MSIGTYCTRCRHYLKSCKCAEPKPNKCKQHERYINVRWSKGKWRAVCAFCGKQSESMGLGVIDSGKGCVEFILTVKTKKKGTLYVDVIND